MSLIRVFAGVSRSNSFTLAEILLVLEDRGDSKKFLLSGVSFFIACNLLCFTTNSSLSSVTRLSISFCENFSHSSKKFENACEELTSYSSFSFLLVLCKSISSSVDDGITAGFRRYLHYQLLPFQIRFQPNKGPSELLIVSHNVCKLNFGGADGRLKLASDRLNVFLQISQLKLLSSECSLVLCDSVDSEPLMLSVSENVDCILLQDMEIFLIIICIQTQIEQHHSTSVYFINFSYLGTTFRGIQRTVKVLENGTKTNDIYTVQGVIELALQRLRPINEIDSIISSRTDAGVHAISTTLHVDLERPDKKAYNPHYITSYLNTTFYKHQIPIRINSTLLIPADFPNFHCRHSAVGRSYLYRLAVPKPNEQSAVSKRDKNFSNRFIPIEEIDRCYFLQNANFNYEAVDQVLSLFVGTHDFRSFMGMSKEIKQKHCMFSIRKIHNLTFTQSQSLSTILNKTIVEKFYNFYDVRVTAKSFLYRQVRKIVGTLISVGYEKHTKKDVYELITIPGTHNWPSSIKLVPACGLYLCEVLYRTMSLLLSIQAMKEKLKSTNTIITTIDGKKINDNGEIISTSAHGYVVDTKPDKIPASIIEGLFLGSQDCVDITVLTVHHITNILSIGVEVDINFPRSIKRKFIECLDLPTTIIHDILNEACSFIDQVLKKGQKLLVHCNAGVSRSSTIIIGYLILYKNMNFCDAYSLVKSKRECIRPNDGFMKQLTFLLAGDGCSGSSVVSFESCSYKYFSVSVGSPLCRLSINHSKSELLVLLEIVVELRVFGIEVIVVAKLVEPVSLIVTPARLSA
uniref:CSON015638 protein n=1 Tax=Culicoides sonorensis TaxID=179676 RepID=A0A336LWW1_CULSO